MPFRSMEQGIAAVQQGNLDEGARLLKIALKSPELKGSLRATALLWLAETKSTRQEKTALYQEVLAADPNNEYARQRMSQLLTADLPPAPPPAPPSTLPGTHHRLPAPPPPTTMPGVQPYSPVPTPVAPTPPPMENMFYRTVGVLDGPNGRGTAFFITRDGLLATTRLVVGGAEAIVIELEPGRQMRGQIVRAYPDLDLALIHTGMTINQLLPVTPQPTVPDSTPLTAVAYGGRVMNGQRRATASDIRQDWFPTTIAEMFDVGGNPIFDNRNFLVGMLTRNANRSSPYVYGLHINSIYRCVEQYLHEIRDGSNRVYCPSCGAPSRATASGGFYCETCGSILPAARNVARFPLPMTQMEALYGENANRPCRNCGARVGYYDGKCLRCGADTAARR